MCVGVWRGMCVCECVEGKCVWVCGGVEHVGRGGTVKGYKYWKGGMVCRHVRAMSS